MISRRDSNAQRIAALDAPARALQLRPGMGIADARAMHPAIEIVEADPQADAQLLASLADWCDRYTPLVALDGADGLLLDITGCAHLFGGERAMLDDLLTRLFHQGFEARGALASTPGAAWAAARFSGQPVVRPGDEADLIAPLPLAALRLDAQTCFSLESVGLRSAGAVMSVPRAPLVRRFGKRVALRLDQALGHVEEAISPRLPVPALSVERRLAEPVGLVEDILGLLLLLAATLKEELERQGKGARRLQLLLFRVDGAVSRIVVGSSRPLRDPPTIGKLFRERLAAIEDQIDAGYGFDLVRLSALTVARLDAEQMDLGERKARREDDAVLFADRVSARLGKGSVLRPSLAQSHVPERAVTYFQPGEVRDADVPPSVGSLPERPIRLFDTPHAVEILAGQDLSFRWRRVVYTAVRKEGPERIAPEWWREEADAATRDYFRVEDGEGHRCWLFRETPQPAGRGDPRWFIQGVFA